MLRPRLRRASTPSGTWCSRSRDGRRRAPTIWSTTSVAEAVFGGRPLGRPVIGRAEAIGVSRRRDAYHRAAYAAATSSSRPPATSRTSGSWSSRRAWRGCASGPRRSPASKPFGRGRGPGTASSEGHQQYHVCLGAPGVSRSDDRRFAAPLLDAILGGSASSRLFQEIREKRGHGLLRLQLRLAVLRLRAGRPLHRYAREENLVESI